MGAFGAPPPQENYTKIQTPNLYRVNGMLCQIKARNKQSKDVDHKYYKNVTVS